VFRLHDSRTGRPDHITPARRGQLATYLASPAGAGPAGTAATGVGLDDLRAALVADLIRRVAERHHLLVTAWQRDPGIPGTGTSGTGTPGTGTPGEDGNGDEPRGAAAAFRLACDALNIHPAQLSAEPPDPLDVQVAGEPPTTGGRWLRPAGVRDDGGLPDGGTLPDGLAVRGHDPLALRLALLRHHHQQPAALSQDTLNGAGQVLSQWREQVAEWARSPSKPMCAQYTTDFTQAFDDDLATPAALATLAALAADEEIPPGSKFEAFAYFDQLLGLDLARQVGY
jgi:hypothetical protein